MKTQKTNIGLFKKTIAFVLCMIMVLSSAVVPVSAAPGMNAKVTPKNILKVLKAYDKDGYFLLKKGKEYGSDFMAWFQNSEKIVDDVVSAVHEQCHACTSTGWDYETIYKGNKKFYKVKYTDVYYSREMVDTVPERLRTFRFSTYIEDPDEYLASNVQGAYGLLNEFAAYCWGMNDTVNLYNYYKKAGSSFDNWQQFINDGANNRQAYSEFNYYILHYLYYAKKHYPDIYKQIMKNKSFKKAYKFIGKKFRSNISKYQKDLKKIVKLMRAAGHEAYIENGLFYCDGWVTNTFLDDYKMLTKEVKKSKYQKIYQKLIS